MARTVIRSICVVVIALLAAPACGEQVSTSSSYSAMDQPISVPGEVAEIWPEGMLLVHEFFYEPGNVGAWISNRDEGLADEWCLSYLGTPAMLADPFPLFGTICTTDQVFESTASIAYLLTEQETIDFVLLPARFGGKQPVILPASLDTDELEVTVFTDQLLIVRYASRPGFAPSYPGSEGASFKVMYSIGCSDCGDAVEVIK